MKREPKDKFQLKEQPFVEVTMRAYRSQEKTEKGGRGIALFSFPDTTTEIVLDSDDGSTTVLGKVVGAVGGFILQDRRRAYSDQYIIRSDDAWDAFQEALDKAGGDFAAMKATKEEENEDEQA